MKRALIQLPYGKKKGKIIMLYIEEWELHYRASRPRIPEWARLENMEMIVSQKDLWALEASSSAGNNGKRIISNRWKAG